MHRLTLLSKECPGIQFSKVTCTFSGKKSDCPDGQLRPNENEIPGLSRKNNAKHFGRFTKTYLLCLGMAGLGFIQSICINLGSDNLPPAMDDSFFRNNSFTVEKGLVSGVVTDHQSGKPLAQAEVLISVKGDVFKAISLEDGTFQLEMTKVNRGEGYNVHFRHKSYQNATRAGIFRLPNLRIDLGTVPLYKNM